MRLLFVVLLYWQQQPSGEQECEQEQCCCGKQYYYDEVAEQRAELLIFRVKRVCRVELRKALFAADTDDTHIVLSAVPFVGHFLVADRARIAELPYLIVKVLTDIGNESVIFLGGGLCGELNGLFVVIYEKAVVVVASHRAEPALGDNVPVRQRSAE